MKLATLLLFLAGVTVTAAGDDMLSRTGLLLNGRAWKHWSEDVKLGYLLGARDSIWTAPGKSESDDKAKYNDDHFGQSTYGEITGGLDDLYRDPANVQIPVKTAMYYFQDKVKGTSPQKLTDELAIFRKLAASQQ